MTIIISGIALALPLSAQYYGNNVTPAGSPPSTVLLGAGGSLSAGGNGHALLHDNTLNKTTDLNPVSATGSVAKGTDGQQEVGYYTYLGLPHCGLWKGTASSVVDMTPPTFTSSWCTGANGGHQTGWALKPFYIYANDNAMLWSGSANSAINLHNGGPSGYQHSRGRAVYGKEQAGEIDQYHRDPEDTTPWPYSQAVLWHGTAASMVILHPAGYTGSGATSTNGVQEGGWGYHPDPDGSLTHALLWSGTAASVVDLHPAGFFDTRINAISTTLQVGDGWVGEPSGIYSPGFRHALSWNGTAASVTDLHQYAPIGYKESVATGIDANGNVVGYAYNVRTTIGGFPPDAIAVVFAPAPMPPAPLSALAFTPAFANSGDTVTAQVTLAAAAPAGGVTVSFLSASPTLVPTPANLVVPEGQTSATFSIPVQLPASLVSPIPVTVYGFTGPIRKSATMTVAPVMVLSSISVGTFQGGTATTGSVTLNIPATSPITVNLTNGNPALSMPSSVSFTTGQMAVYFTATSTTVVTDTPGTVSATYNGITVSSIATVISSVPLTVVSVNVPAAYSGTTFTGTVTLNHAAYLNGATVLLSTGDPNVAPVPASINIQYGLTTGTFTGTAGLVQSSATVPITATLNGTTATGSVTVSATPGATFTGLDYWTVSKLLKVTVSTTLPNGALTFGVSPDGPALGVLNLDPTTNTYQGSISLPAAPATVWVWNSQGAPVSSSTVRLRSR